MKIRPATTADLDAVVRNESSSFSTPWSRHTFLSLLARHTVIFRVAEDDEGELIGHGIIWWVFDEAELANLAIAPSARGKGVGGSLLDVLLAEVALHGVLRVFLEVRKSNEAAHRLYRSRGFEAVGERRNYYVNPREDAIVLQLDFDVDLSRAS